MPGEELKLYHLHKHSPDGLHFEVNHASDYVVKHKDHCYTPHRHSFYQVIWFTSSGLHHIDYKDFEHEADCLFFINTGQVHNFCMDAANEGYLFHFNDAFLIHNKMDRDNWSQYKLFNEISSPVITPQEPVLGQLRQINQLAQQDYNYRSQVYFLFQVLLLKLERLKRQQHQHLPESDPDFQLVVRFRELIDAHINEMQAIEFYSEQLGVNRKKLSNLSKQFLGDTPANVIAERKILEAKRLLSNTKRSIKEIGYQLGFDQATYFTKYFKKFTGLTPKDFAASIH